MPRSLSDGLVVVFDGVDGVGKSTQIELVRHMLAEDGWQPHVTRNLGGTPIGELLRSAMLQPVPRPPLTDLYASVAIQEALVASVAEERKLGNVVLMDRSPLSLAAYQIYGSGIEAELGWQHVDNGMQALRPELIIVYEADLAAALERARRHSVKADYFEDKPLDYFKKVAAGFRAAAERYNIHFINADRSIKEIHQDTVLLIQQAVTKKAG